MLKSFKLHNFKTFLNCEVQLSRRHLLLGKNSSGKTNFASALQFLAGTCGTTLDQAASFIPGGVAEISNWGTTSEEVELSCTCELDFEGDLCEFVYQLSLLQSSPTFSDKERPGLQVRKERLSVTCAGFDNVVLLENDGREALLTHERQVTESESPHRPRTLAPKNATMLSKLFELETNRRAILFRNYLGGWCYFSLSPYAMRHGPAPATPTAVVLGSLGHELSDVIFHLKNRDERRYRRLIKHAQIVEPALEAINFYVSPDQRPLPAVELSGKSQASWTGLSDGALRTLALAYIIERASAFSPPNWPTSSLTIIEEPENGLFPGQLRQIFDLFEEWAPTSQFIFTSHSPYFIDMFDNKRDCVTIFRKTGDRSEVSSPSEAANGPGDERFSLSTEYASDLF